MEVHYVDETYRDTQDGIREPFRWAHFANPRFLSVGFLLAVLVIAALGSNESAETAGQGVGVGAHVAANAVRAARALGGPL